MTRESALRAILRKKGNPMSDDSKAARGAVGGEASHNLAGPYAPSLRNLHGRFVDVPHLTPGGLPPVLSRVVPPDTTRFVAGPEGLSK